MAKRKATSKAVERNEVTRLASDKLYKSVHTRILKTALRIGKKYGVNPYRIERDIMFRIGHSLKIAGK